MHEINVLYTFDTRFWRLAAVAINKMMRAQKNTRVNVYCMVAPFTRGRRVIRNIVEKNGGKLIWKTVARRHNPYKNYDFSRWSPVIFFRLFAHRVFPNVDRMIYMDSDTLVMDDLWELYNTDLSGCVLGAVRDLAPLNSDVVECGKYVRMFKEKYLKHNLYVNSGVLVLDLNAVRGVEKDLMAVDIPLRYPDQDLINRALDGKILELHLRYNFIPSCPKTDKFSDDVFQTAIENPVIYHFYAAKPYMFQIAPRSDYEMFSRAAMDVGMCPEQFVAQERRACRRRQKSHLCGLRRGRDGVFRWFGIRIF